MDLGEAWRAALNLAEDAVASRDTLRITQEQLQQEMESMLLIQQFSNEMISIVNEDKIFNSLLDISMQLMQSDFASIQYYDAELERLVLQGHINLHPRSAKHWHIVTAASSTACGEALRKKERTVIADVEDSSYVEEDRKYFRLSGIRAVQSTPLVSRKGELLGMLSTMWKEVRTLQEDNYKFFDVIVRQAADLIERKKAEEAIRKSDEQKEFLLKLNDALRHLADPAKIQDVASRMIGEYLKASRVAYAEVDGEEIVVCCDYNHDVSSMIGRYPKNTFGDDIATAFETTKTFWIHDVKEAPGLSKTEKKAYQSAEIAAHIGTTIYKEGKMSAGLGVHQSTPRYWRTDEISLVETAAERLWTAIERAKAEKTLRDNEDKLRQFNVILEREVMERTAELEYANADLKKTKEHFASLFHVSPVATSLSRTTDGSVMDVNPAWERMFDLKRENVIGKNASELNLSDPEDRNRLINKIDGKTGKLMGAELSFKKWDGKVLNTFISVAKIKLDGIDCFLTAYFDITERKKAEDTILENTRMLREKNLQLEQTNAQLESFTFISSHDLQEPLRKIQTFAGRILEKENQNLSESGKDYFHRMRRATQRMQSLIQDLLSFSRLSTTERKFELTNLSTLTEQVMEDFKEVIAEKNAQLDIELKGEASIIPFQFQQILHNLIGNALKFSRPDTPPHITIKTRMIKSYAPLDGKAVCHITVADNGIGFEQKYNQKIFDIFQKLHGKDEYEGTGIGLAIVRKIIEIHNGTISAKGKVNKGATFDIYLPIHQ